MKMKAYAVLDNKAGNYNRPFFMQNNAMAIRAFGDLANDKNSMIGQHPEDYTLHLIGEYEDDTAKLTPVKNESIVNASAMVKQTKL